MTSNDAPNKVDAFDDAAARVEECIAMMEMAWRVPEWNVEDFKMLQRVCFVTFERLNSAKQSLEAVKSQSPGGQP